MGEFTASVIEAFKSRFTTSILGTYFLFWAAIHWQFFYVTFFVNEDLIMGKYKMIKNEYVNTYFIAPNFENWFTFCVWIAGYILPIILTILWIWVLPSKLFIHVFKKEHAYGYEKRKHIIMADIDLKKLKEESAKKSADIANIELATAKKELDKAQLELEVTKNDLIHATSELKKLSQDAESNTGNDTKEKLFDDFSHRADARNVLDEISRCYYKHNGSMKVSDGFGGSIYRISPDLLKVADTHGLVEIEGSKLKLTDLGKYFLSRV